MQGPPKEAGSFCQDTCQALHRVVDMFCGSSQHIGGGSDAASLVVFAVEEVKY